MHVMHYVMHYVKRAGLISRNTKTPALLSINSRQRAGLVPSTSNPRAPEQTRAKSRDPVAARKRPRQSI